MHFTFYTQLNASGSLMVRQRCSQYRLFCTTHSHSRDGGEAWEEAAVGVLAPGDLLRVFGHFLSAAELIRVIMRVIMTGAWSLSPDNRGGSF